MRVFRKTNNNYRALEYGSSRYLNGGNSESGSRGEFANFKLQKLNAIFEELNIYKAAELGCGDGYILTSLKLDRYTGYDSSKEVIYRHQRNYSESFHFKLCQPRELIEIEADIDAIISMDVILHLVDDLEFEMYMRSLFSNKTQYVIIYNTNSDSQDPNMAPHNRYRNHQNWIDRNFENDYQLREFIEAPNSLGYLFETGFYVYEKK